MKNFILRIRFRFVLPLLLLAILVTFPSTVTGSKYVWKEDIGITLKVNYPEQEITSLLSANISVDDIQLQLTNIQATTQANGLVLSVKEGYRLPESFTVQIGENSYSIYTDGLNNPEGITFDPETGMLSISDILTMNGQESITITAYALQSPEAP